MSDVLELYDENGSNFFYCDRFGFQEIGFTSSEQTQTMAEQIAPGLWRNLFRHVSLVYRGSKENAAKFTEVQDSVLSQLYPEETESQESEDQSQPETPVEPPVESGAE